MTYPRFAIDQNPLSVQSLTPPSTLERFEGVDFSSSGKMLGIATPDTNAVLLFRQKDDGRFEDAPYSRIDGPASRLNYPHDVAFSMCGETELLAVAQRAGAIAIYARSRESETYSPAPVYEIRGPNSQLEFSDGVAFVPPHNQYLAVCNLTLATISFYRRLSVSPIRFEVVPEFQLRHPSVSHVPMVWLSHVAVDGLPPPTMEIIQSVFFNGAIRFSRAANYDTGPSR